MRRGLQGLCPKCIALGVFGQSNTCKLPEQRFQKTSCGMGQVLLRGAHVDHALHYVVLGCEWLAQFFRKRSHFLILFKKRFTRLGGSDVKGTLGCLGRSQIHRKSPLAWVPSNGSIKTGGTHGLERNATDCGQSAEVP